MARKLGVLALFAITWCFYSWTARSNGKPFVFDHQTRDYYNMLVDGFQAGHLYLPVTPDPRLSQAADPYDPEQNEPYRMHDASFYRGKFYLYFGAAPAVTLLLPFRIITGLKLPESLAVVLFLFAGLIASYWSFQFIVRRFAPQTPAYFSIIAVVLLGFCNFAPFIARRPAFYELAIACAYFYYFAAAYFLITGLLGERKSNWRLAAGAACLGLTLAARPNYIVVVSFIFCTAAATMFWGKTARIQDHPRQLLALCLPFVFVFAALLAYNYLRFDNLLEFGQRYQLENFRIGKFFSPHYFLHNFRAYMWSTPHINRHFPFFHLKSQQALVYSVPYGEPVGGALATAPLVGLMFLLIPMWVYLARGRSAFDRLRPLEILATLFSVNGLLTVLVLSLSGGLTERYLLDFIPSFLFSAILVWIILHQALQTSPRYKWAMNGILVFLLTFQVFLNVGVSLTGYYDNLFNENPAVYGRIRSWFSFVER